MKLSYLFLLLAISLSAYEGCGLTKQDALLELSGKIRTTVQSEIKMTTSSVRTASSSEESIEEKVDTLSKNSTHLSLVKIKYTKKAKMICASVKESDQVKNTSDLLSVALLFDAANLPKNIDEKIKKLSEWLEKLDELSYLVPEFYKPTNKQLSKEKALLTLTKKEKTFQDIYDSSIAKADALIFKACDSTKEEAFNALNKKLFANKTKKQDDEGIFGKTASFFSSIFSASKDDSKMLELFASQVVYSKEKKKQCAVIKKSDLLGVANTLNADIKRFQVSSLSQNPIIRYKEILNYQEHLNVTKALLELYPNNFTKTDFKRITKVKQALANKLKTTFPQYVKFEVNGAQEIRIKVDDKKVEANKEIYLKKGEHTYTISAKGKCPISDTFSLDLFDKEDISKDLSEYNYPTVLFVSEKDFRISIDGESYKSNIANTIKKCDAELRWMVKYDGQNKNGILKLSAGEKKTIELNFLSTQELSVFNDAKTKNFQAQSGVKFSESLTPVMSNNLEFVVESKPEHGELKLHEKGSFTYKAKDGYVGLDTFEYIIKTDDEISAPKIVNIRVSASDMPVVVTPVVAQQENNTTKIKEKVKQEEVAVKDKSDADEIRYQKFKAYVNSQAQNVEKLKKLQSKYPKLFNRLLKEKMSGL